MRSQVQVLAGPPPIVAGHSAADSEPGALAASLGRTRAARPSPLAPPVAPPGPPALPSGSATTTHRGRAPARGRQPCGGCSHPGAAACFYAHRRPRGALRAPTWPAWSLSGQARPPRPARHRRPRSATDLPLANAAWAASPASRPPRPSIEPSTPGSPRGRHRFRWSGSPGHLDLVPTPPPEWEETDASGRTAGR
jgi:hypothetical protein